MATPKWNKQEKRWRLDERIGGRRRVFTSSIEGRRGLAAVNKARNAALLGESDKSGWRFEKCWEQYLEHVKKMTSLSNYNQRESYGRLYIMPTLRLKKMSRISEQDWQDIITDAHGAHNKALSKKTLSNLRGTITDFCKYARKSRMIDAVPVLELPRNALTVEKGILQPEQLKKLFQPSTAWYVNAWRLQVLTGLRPGEIMGIQQKDIVKGVLTVKRSINVLGEITPGKNKNAKRIIVLSPMASNVINNQLEKLSDECRQTEWLFPKKDGSMPDHQSMYREWCEFRIQNDVKIPPYGLRHTFVSLTQHSIPESMLRQMVGHSATMDTYGTYGHEVSGDGELAAEMIEQAFRKWLV